MRGVNVLVEGFAPETTTYDWRSILNSQSDSAILMVKYFKLTIATEQGPPVASNFSVQPQNSSPPLFSGFLVCIYTYFECVCTRN